MARLPLVDPEAGDPSAIDVLRRIAAERERPFNVYRVLANSPGLAERIYGVSSFLWNESALRSTLVEVVILRVAQLTRSEYEWCRHVGLARRVGVPEVKIERLEIWRTPESTFDDEERAALALTEEIIEKIEADEATVSRVREQLGERGTLELTVLIGFYGMIAGMLRSLAVDAEPGDTAVFSAV